jgi:hypothetical protein
MTSELLLAAIMLTDLVSFGSHPAEQGWTVSTAIAAVP